MQVLPTNLGTLIQSDDPGGTAAPVGFTDTDPDVSLRSTPTGPAPSWQLQVEVKPLATPFNAATGMVLGSAVPSGGTSEATVTGLLPGDYPWRARAVPSGAGLGGPVGGVCRHRSRAAPAVVDDGTPGSPYGPGAPARCRDGALSRRLRAGSGRPASNARYGFFFCASIQRSTSASSVGSGTAPWRRSSTWKSVSRNFFPSSADAFSRIAWIFRWPIL